MPAASMPFNEVERITALRSYDILDTGCEDSFDTLAWLASSLAHCPTALISLVDSERQWFKARLGFDARETSRASSFAAHAILTPSQPLIVPDATADPRFADNPLVVGPPFIRSYVGIPIVNPQGYALGALCVISLEAKAVSTKDIAILTGLTKSVTNTLELRRAMTQIRDLVLTDPLTGLPNRSALYTAVEQRISEQRTNGSSFGVMYFDLDNFKIVNDTLGHRVGDTVLKAVAGVLRSTTRKGDTIGRLGSDEFAVVLADYDQADGPFVADRLRAAINKAMRIGGWDVTVSVGGVSAAGLSDESCDVLASADAAMYVAKAAGGNRSHWCSLTVTCDGDDQKRVSKFMNRGAFSVLLNPVNTERHKT